MAQRRMFSKVVTSSARFLKMPQEAQNLYFHLAMNADDDGIVEGFTIMNMLGSSEDNIRILNAKNLVKVLNEDLVAYIMDWNEHNLIRADRKVNSIYKDLLLQIMPDVEIKEPKPRADTKVIPRQLNTGRPVDGIGKDRLGKVSIDKDSKEENTSISSKEENADDIKINKNLEINAIYDLYKSKGIDLPLFFGNPTEKKSAKELYRIKGVKKISDMLDYCLELIENTKPEEKRFILRFDTPFHLLKNYEAIKMKM